MPKISNHLLVNGSFGVKPTKGERPSTADPTKSVEVDAYAFVWSDGLDTYVIQIDEDLLEAVEQQIADAKAAHAADGD